MKSCSGSMLAISLAFLLVGCADGAEQEMDTNCENEACSDLGVDGTRSDTMSDLQSDSTDVPDLPDLQDGSDSSTDPDGVFNDGDVAGDSTDGSCEPSEDLCSGECADLQWSEQHCGACGSPCDGQCIEGSCHQLDAVAPGGEHTCGLLGDGSVVCWGNNENGQLGTGAPDEWAATAQQLSLSQVEAVVSGWEHSCALLDDGTVWCWGDNDKGQLGPVSGDPTSPLQLPEVSGAIELTAGAWSTCAQIDADTVSCWGDQPLNSSPGSIHFSEAEMLDQIAVHSEELCALDSSGDVWCTSSAQAPPQKKLAFEASTLTSSGGWYDMCAIRALDGSVWCWSKAEMPRQMPGVTGATDLAGGAAYLCAQLGSGSVMCWNEPDSPAAALVPDLSSSAMLYGGYASTCSLTNGGAHRCWGLRRFGNLGDGVNHFSVEPVQTVDLAGVTSLSTMEDTICAVDGTADALCWGKYQTEEMAPADAEWEHTPVSLGLGSATRVVTGDQERCIISDTDGFLHCLGHDGPLARFGQVTDASLGETNCMITDDGYGMCARRLEDDGDSIAQHGLLTSIATEPDGPEVCASTQQGGLLCWYGDGGEIGLEEFPQVGSVSNVVLGNGFKCLLNTDGRVRCWGDNDKGQLGLGHTGFETDPVVIAGLNDAVSLAAGYSHTCVVHNDGRVSCWGENSFGQLGSGNTRNASSPQLVPGLHNVREVVAGQRHTCAVVTSGEVYCWGDRRHGQLGDGYSEDVITPVLVDW